MDAETYLRVLYFFVPAYVANMSPVLVKGWIPVLAGPIDAGRTWRGKRLLGDHKTWRGLLAGIVGGTVVWEGQRFADGLGWCHALALLDYAAHPVWPGFLLGLGTGVGDALKSFVKRQVDIAPGASWPVFDQLDFMFGAYVFVAAVYAPPLVPTLAILPVVFGGSILTTVIGYSLGLKEAWI